MFHEPEEFLRQGSTCIAGNLIPYNGAFGFFFSSQQEKELCNENGEVPIIFRESTKKQQTRKQISLECVQIYKVQSLYCCNLFRHF